MNSNSLRYNEINDDKCAGKLSFGDVKNIFARGFGSNAHGFVGFIRS